VTPQRMIPELLIQEWEAWTADPAAQLPCPAKGCGRTSAAYWDGVNETLRWTGCGHRAFFPEQPAPWPPPETHVRREEPTT
jgi:hypothetical protein